MLTVILERVSDGQRANHAYEGPWSDTEDFMWSDGNFGCDCNRQIFFERALGLEPSVDPACGDSAYRVVSVTDEAGKIVYAEDAESQRTDA
jgi:hypothetical protein